MKINKNIFIFVTALVSFDVIVCFITEQYLLMLFILVLYPCVLLELTGVTYIYKKIRKFNKTRNF
jgi:hypothetical protein